MRGVQHRQFIMQVILKHAHVLLLLCNLRFAFLKHAHVHFKMGNLKSYLK